MDGVDEAILARCAVVIDYDLPSREDARTIWGMLAEGHGANLGDGLLDTLVETFPNITPRDIKMILRLALRIAAFRKDEANLEAFITAAKYRGIHPA